MAPTSPLPPIDVPRPPPVAVPETVSEPPETPEEWVWIDGTWHYALGRWVWHRGGWAKLPAGALYFPGRVTHTRDGRILYQDAAWLDEDGRRLPAPSIEKPATTPRADRSVEGLF